MLTVNLLGKFKIGDRVRLIGAKRMAYIRCVKANADHVELTKELRGYKFHCPSDLERC